jgi:hypothetical protein
MDGIDPDFPWAYRHEDGQLCRKTRAGRWLLANKGLAPEAECPRDHTDEDRLVPDGIRSDKYGQETA